MEDDTAVESDAPTVRLEAWTGPIDPDDPDANFKTDVAAYSLADPLLTIRNVASNLDLPVGAVARYVLAKWTSGGAEALLELGPTTIERMRAIVAEAEADGTDEARLAAYASLSQMLAWLGHGLDDPEGTYPTGGADPTT